MMRTHNNCRCVVIRIPRWRIAIPDVVERFRAYYKVNEDWGALHVVMEDGNVSDDSVLFCARWAAEQYDFEGEQLANILLRMTKTQRRKLPYKV